MIDGSAPEGLQQLLPTCGCSPSTPTPAVSAKCSLVAAPDAAHEATRQPFEDCYEYETHHISALFGGVSIVLGWFAGCWPPAAPGPRPLAYCMTAELRGTRDELASTLNAIPGIC